jgi:hypothetical protein
MLHHYLWLFGIVLARSWLYWPQSFPDFFPALGLKLSSAMEVGPLILQFHSYHPECWVARLKRLGQLLLDHRESQVYHLVWWLRAAVE